MKQIILTVIAIALVANAIFLGVLAFKGNTGSGSLFSREPVDSLSNTEWRQAKASIFVEKIIKSNLYYPDSYSLAEIQVDSLFYSYMADPSTVNAAIQLIDAESELGSAQGSVESANNSYLEAQNTLKVFGSSGVFWRHRKDRDEAAQTLQNAKAELNSAKDKVTQLKSVIKNRDTSQDGKYIGWQVYCRYRAQTNKGTVSFGSNLFLLDPKMEKCIGTFSIDEGNKDFDDIKKVIESTLNINYQ